MQHTGGQLVIKGQGTNGAISVACDCGTASTRVVFCVDRPPNGRDWAILGPDGKAIVLTVNYERAIELARVLAVFSCHGRKWWRFDV